MVDVLLRKGIITQQQAKVAVQEHRKTGKPLEQVLVELAFCSEEDLAKALAEDAGLPFMEDIHEADVDPSLLQKCDLPLLMQYGAVPLRREGSTVLVASADPYNVPVLDKLAEWLSAPVRLTVVPKSRIAAFLSQHYRISASDVEQIIQQMEKEQAGQEKQDAEGSAVVKFVDTLLHHAAAAGATDVHFEPLKEFVRIKYRVDGVLRQMFLLSAAAYPAVVNRIKVLAKLNIAEKRLPQDGRFSIAAGGGEGRERIVDVRVSTIPSLYGEGIVLRLLGQSGTAMKLEELGFSERDVKLLRRAAHMSYGMVVITGPTGSGKTTTIYAVLQLVDSVSRKVLTVEDPIEYTMPLLVQTQVNEDAGYTFSEALRAFLRHDPDVIFFGEIRDKDTAELGVRAAMTGHLVFTTLHTNTALEAHLRLLNLGVDQMSLAAALLLTTGQRLVRRLCHHCRFQTGVTLRERLSEIGIDGQELPSELQEVLDTPTWNSWGCEMCEGIGFKGRTVIAEACLWDTGAKDLLLRGASFAELAEHFRSQGMLTMFEDGLKKASLGITTLEEVLRVVNA